MSSFKLNATPANMIDTQRRHIISITIGPPYEHLEAKEAPDGGFH
jgi:hypothetical protein